MFDGPLFVYGPSNVNSTRHAEPVNWISYYRRIDARTVKGEFRVDIVRAEHLNDYLMNLLGSVASFASELASDWKRLSAAARRERDTAARRSRQTPRVPPTDGDDW